MREEVSIRLFPLKEGRKVLNITGRRLRFSGCDRRFLLLKKKTHAFLPAAIYTCNRPLIEAVNVKIFFGVRSG